MLQNEESVTLVTWHFAAYISMIQSRCSHPGPEEVNASLGWKHQGNDRDDGKEYHKDDREIENQTFYPAPGLEYRTCTAAAKGAAQACPTRLQQDKDDDGRRENDLYDSERREP